MNEEKRAGYIAGFLIASFITAFVVIFALNYKEQIPLEVCISQCRGAENILMYRPSSGREPICYCIAGNISNTEEINAILEAEHHER